MAEDDDKSKERSGEPGEGEKERRDRELIELLNELRVVLPGVQVLFAFLLTVPFSNGYSIMTDLQRDVYFVTFLATTIATVLLIANRMTIAGTALLAVAMTSAVFVITDVLFGEGVAALVSALAGLALAGVWYALPLVRRAREGPRRG